MLHVSSFSQTHGFPAPRFQRWPRASVPSHLVTASSIGVENGVELFDPAARNGVVDIPDLRSHTLNQLSDALPSALPCTSCGGWKMHWPWCPTLGPNVRVAFHPRKLIGWDGTWHATGSEA